MNKQLEIWLRELLPYSKLEDFFQITENEDGSVRVRFYTNDHIYTIIFKEQTNYVGCAATTRKHRAGEDWNRGNDLPDGQISGDTWNKIKNAIIRYELVAIERRKPSADVPKVSETVEKN